MAANDSTQLNQQQGAAPTNNNNNNNHLPQPTTNNAAQDKLMSKFLLYTFVCESDSNEGSIFS